MRSDPSPVQALTEEYATQAAWRQMAEHECTHLLRERMLSSAELAKRHIDFEESHDAHNVAFPAECKTLEDLLGSHTYLKSIMRPHL